jgi:signal transduction histidine kinase
VIKDIQNIEYTIYPNEFLQVMINIISNAADAITNNGVITIKLFRKNGDIIISVEDNGKGIEKDAISKIFDPYYSTKKDSMGLGLYMSKMIIEKHLKGEIFVESSLGDGAKFIIKFNKNYK